MNEKNKKEVWRIIQSHGDSLIKKLSPHPNHPNGRNPYAHICNLIKSHFGCSYKEVKTRNVKNLLILLSELKIN